ncbi:MAG: right-handed parallel beta-helix repeat-containing protein [Caldilineaceae bacterium]
MAAPRAQSSANVGRQIHLPLVQVGVEKPTEIPDTPTPLAPTATPTVPSTPTASTPIAPTPASPTALPTDNPCADDEFLDLAANVCRKLDRPELGFDFGRFYGWLDENKVVNSACDEKSFEAALAQAAGGGIVRLPACTLEIGRINVPSQVVIEGAGIGQTILVGKGCDNPAPRRVLLIQNQSDVVLRGVSLDAGGRNCVMLEIDHSTNVLIERLAIYNSTEVGLRFNNGARNITIRYTDIYNNGDLHGIGSKDCDTGAILAACPEAMWTSSYSIHSNKLHDHGDHGLNLHGINGEVAGNQSYNNHHSGKFYDAQCVWVHHNEFRNNQAWNIFIAPTLNIEARASHDVYFYKNQYLDTPAGEFSWGISYTGDNVTLPLEKYTNIYVMDNQYAGRLKTNEVTLNVCPNTTEDGIAISPKQYGDAATCSLSSYPSMGGSVYPQPLGNCPVP